MAGKTQYPSSAQIIAQEGTLRVGQNRVDHEQAGNLWGSGVSARDFEKVMFWKYRTKLGRYFMSVFMLYFAARAYPGHQVDYEWREMGKTRQDSLVTALGATGSATITFNTTRTEQYVLVGDVLRSSTGMTFQVTNVDVSGGTEVVTVVKTVGGNFAVGNLTNNQRLGYSHNIFGEGTGQPGGRKWRPVIKSNKMGILKSTSENTGDARTTRAEIDLGGGGDPVWISVDEQITVDEHFISRENMVMFAEESVTGASPISPRGIERDILANATASTTYAGAVDEADLQAQLLLFNVINDNDEFTILAGQKFIYDTVLALADYYNDGAVNYGSFSANKEMAVGMGISQYRFGSKTMNFVEYKGFNDRDVTGTPLAGPTVTDIDYRNFGLILNMGESGGDGEGLTIPYLSYKYKVLNGVDRRLVAGFYSGMTGLENSLKDAGLTGASLNTTMSEIAMAHKVSHDGDSEKFFLLSQIGPRLVGVDTAHGWMRATS